MTHSVMLTITSLLSILFMAFHLANSIGVFFWVWTLIALGVTTIFAAILSAHGLWSLRWGKSRATAAHMA